MHTQCQTAVPFWGQRRICNTRKAIQFALKAVDGKFLSYLWAVRDNVGYHLIQNAGSKWSRLMCNRQDHMCKFDIHRWLLQAKQAHALLFAELHLFFLCDPRLCCGDCC